MFNSIFFNNYKAIYLINNRNLLKLDFFKKTNPRKIIKYNFLSLLIIEYSIYILKNYFNKSNKLESKDLVLSKIVLIKGFYINIVLKALFIKKNI